MKNIFSGMGVTVLNQTEKQCEDKIGLLCNSQDIHVKRKFNKTVINAHFVSLQIEGSFNIVICRALDLLVSSSIPVLV